MSDQASSNSPYTASPRPVLVDPFASPATHPVGTPRYPEPTARLPARTSDHTYSDEALATTDLPSSRRAPSSPGHKSASMSSAGQSSTLTAMSSFDLEKNAAKDQERESRRSKRDSARDPEKAFYSAQSPRSHRSSRHSRRQSREDAVSATYSDVESEIDAGLALQEAKAMKILFFLSGPVVALSFLNLIWTLISLAITTLSQPVRLCARRITFGQQLASLLGPALNLQLKSIYTPLPPHANEDGVFHPGMLVFVHCVSPVLSIGVAVAAWVVAAYWLMAGIVGDPAGMDKRDDGRETVLGLRGWWENLMLKGINLE
ncbi:hypothetical protein WHR41_00179 [Cladosporium halotolerans]|uniref:Uncharacterized protein n=1 Tax=Cladosporium halotolerans TaxID=1052096 RepID=A0AB34L1D8_9PEZI